MKKFKKVAALALVGVLAAGLLSLAAFLNLPWLADISAFLKDRDNLIKLILGVLAAAGLMYIISSIFGGKMSKGSESFNASFLRLIFLLLEAYHCLYS